MFLLCSRDVKALKVLFSGALEYRENATGLRRQKIPTAFR
jgi:hypothetical protein